MDSKRSDEELMEEFKAGNEKAFEELYKRYYKYIYSLIMRLTSDNELSEDLTDEAFLKLIQYKLSYKPSKSTFKNWLYSIAINTYKEYIRKHHPTKRIDEHLYRMKQDEDISDPYEIIARENEIKNIRNAIEKLPTNLKIPIILKYDHNLKYSEISEILKTPERTLKWRVKKALLLIEKELQK